MSREELITIIVSIIWGLGLAVLFRKSCDNDSCIIIKPPSDFLINEIIEENGKKYKLYRYNYPCNN